MDSASLQAHIRLLRRQLQECRDTGLLCEGIFTEAPLGIAVYSPVEDGEDFLFVDLNPAGQRMVGMPRDAVRGRSLGELFPGSRPMGLLDALAAAWRTGEPQRLSPREYRDERISLWAENHIVRLAGRYVVSFFLDVTPWIESRLEERRGFMRFRRLYSRLHEGFFFVTRGKIVEANAAAEALVEAPPGGLTGRPWRSLVAAGSQQMAALVEQLLDEKGSAPLLELELVRPSGIVPAHLTAYQEEEGWWAMVRDATEVCRMREAVALRDQEERTLAALGEKLLGEIDLTSLGHHVVEAAVRLTGSQYGLAGFFQEDGSFVGSASSEAMAQCRIADHPPVFGPFQGVLALGREDVVVIDDVASHPLARGVPPGHVPITSLYLCPVRFGGKTIGMLCVANAPAGYGDERCRRVLERLANIYALALRRSREEEARREQELRQAKENQAAAWRLAAQMMERLQHPAEILLEMATSLQQHPLPLRLQGYVESIAECARDLARGIRQAHTAWREDFVVHESVFDLHETLTTLGTRLRPQWAARGLDFHVFLDPLVPQWVRSDPGAIVLVLTHLLDNALHNTNCGGVRLTAQAIADPRVPQERWELRLCVEDTGAGMTVDQQRAIAEFFVHGHGSGVGSGLLAVRRVLAAMDGTFHLTSRLAHGTAACVCLPVGRAQPPQPTWQVLVVDDEPLQRSLMRRLLQQFSGITVLEAERGSEAIHLVAREPIQLIFLDFSLPDISGLELVRRIRRMEEEGRIERTPLWLVTGFDMSDLASLETQEALSLVQGVLHKPVDGDRLREVLLGVGFGVGEDWDHSAALGRLGGNADLLAQMRRMFVEEAPQRMAEADAALQRGDVTQALRAVHAIKGNAATIGALGLSALARAVHEALRQDHVAEAAVLMSALRRSLDAVRKTLATMEEKT